MLVYLYKMLLTSKAFIPTPAMFLAIMTMVFPYLYASLSYDISLPLYENSDGSIGTFTFTKIFVFENVLMPITMHTSLSFFKKKTFSNRLSSFLRRKYCAYNNDLPIIFCKP